MAARVISEQTGEKEKDIQNLLIATVQEGRLPVYKPGSDVCYKPSTVRDFYEEAFWDDLNFWMDEFLPRIEWRFPGDEVEELGNLTIAAAIGAEPDYQEYLALEESILLIDAINYALGVPPEPAERNTFSDHREKDYALLLKRAKSAIHSDLLNAVKKDGEYRISKKAFRSWVGQQGIVLNQQYLDLESKDSSLNREHNSKGDSDHSGELLTGMGLPSQRFTILRKIVMEMLEDHIFDLSDPRWPRTKIWQKAVKDYPKLFPNDPSDQREGVFAKAYNRLRSTSTSAK
jgi:hypothetical protein